MKHCNDFNRSRALRLAVLATLVCLSVIGLVGRRLYDRKGAERENGPALDARDSVSVPRTRDDSLDIFVNELLDYLKDEPENYIKK